MMAAGDVPADLRKLVFSFLDMRSKAMVLQTSSNLSGFHALSQARKYGNIHRRMRNSLAVLPLYRWWYPGLSRPAVMFVEMAPSSTDQQSFMAQVFSSLHVDPEAEPIIHQALPPSPARNQFLSTILDMNLSSPPLLTATEALRSCHLDVYWLLTRPQPLLAVFLFKKVCMAASGRRRHCNFLHGGFWVEETLNSDKLSRVDWESLWSSMTKTTILLCSFSCCAAKLAGAHVVNVNSLLTVLGASCLLGAGHFTSVNSLLTVAAKDSSMDPLLVVLFVVLPN